jgi:hypothetical protein
MLSRQALPFIIPHLTKPPISAASARALAVVAEAAGSLLNARIPLIVGAVIDAMTLDMDVRAPLLLWLAWIGCLPGLGSYPDSHLYY